MEISKDHKLTKEEILALMLEKTEELGRAPKKKEMDAAFIGAVRREFGKWIYALEEAGLRTPSEATLQRRRRQSERKAKARRKQVKRH